MRAETCGPQRSGRGRDRKPARASTQADAVAQRARALRASASQAIVWRKTPETRARAKGGSDERTARLFAMQLARWSRCRRPARAARACAAAAKAAKGAVEHNAYVLQRQLAERSKLLTELEAAKMQERVADALQRIGTFAPSTDVPTLEEIRDRIDRRIAQASGRYELANEGVEARVLDVEHALADARGDKLLDEIRRKSGKRDGSGRAM